MEPSIFNTLKRCVRKVMCVGRKLGNLETVCNGPRG